MQPGSTAPVPTLVPIMSGDAPPPAPESDAAQLGRWYLLYRHAPPTLLILLLFPLALECLRTLLHRPALLPYLGLGLLAVLFFAFALTNYAAHGLWRAFGRIVVGFLFLIAAVFAIEYAFQAWLDDRFATAVTFVFYSLLIISLLLLTHRLAMIDLRLAAAHINAEPPAGELDELSDFDIEKWDQVPRP